MTFADSCNVLMSLVYDTSIFPHSCVTSVSLAFSHTVFSLDMCITRCASSNYACKRCDDAAADVKSL